MISRKSGKKVDNHDPSAKLRLRRYFLERYHPEPPSVFDACQGSGILWTELKRSYPVSSYWGVDRKPKPGRMKIDSVEVLSQPGWNFDVIDIDAYGSPWDHYAAVLRNLRRPASVFLTIGNAFLGQLSDRMLSMCGLVFPTHRLPSGLHKRLDPILLRYALFEAMRYRILIEEVAEVESDGNARYLGVRLIPGAKDGVGDA